MQPSVVLGDLGTQLSDALGNAIRVLFAFIPALIGALLILLVGWIVARVVAAVLARVLRAMHFDQLMARTGLNEFLERGGVRTDPAGLLAGIVFWFVFLIFVLAAAKALALEAITVIVTAIVLFLPNLVVALLIIIVGALVARFVGDFVRSSIDAAGVRGGALIAAIARYAILAFAVILALAQLGIGAGIIQTLFAGVMFGLALALALAFGLGGRETARDIVESWYGAVTGRRPGEPPIRKSDTTLPPSPPTGFSRPEAPPPA